MVLIVGNYTGVDTNARCINDEYLESNDVNKGYVDGSADNISVNEEYVEGVNSINIKDHDMIVETVEFESITSPKIFIINLDRKPERYEYVAAELDRAGMTGYQRWSAVDGFNTDANLLIYYGTTEKLSSRKGLAGCASSHMNLWRYIVEENIEWTLVLEDDAHLHPEFPQLFRSYCAKVPVDAKIVYLGHCGINHEELGSKNVVRHAAMCTHAYLISRGGAEYLLNNILPVDQPIDIAMVEHFYETEAEGCYVFNGTSYIDGIRPHDYKDINGKRCNFDGIVYQDEEGLGSTIHGVETYYAKDNIVT